MQTDLARYVGFGGAVARGGARGDSHAGRGRSPHDTRRYLIVGVTQATKYGEVFAQLVLGVGKERPAGGVRFGIHPTKSGTVTQEVTDALKIPINLLIPVKGTQGHLCAIPVVALQTEFLRELLLLLITTGHRCACKIAPRSTVGIQCQQRRPLHLVRRQINPCQVGQTVDTLIGL